MIFSVLFLTLLFNCAKSEAEINKFSSKETTCFVAGECVDGYLLDLRSANDEFQCLDSCSQEDTGCTQFTFFPETNVCLFFQNCTKIDVQHCQECLSGDGGCEPDEPKCGILGECRGNILFTEQVESQDDCLLLCKETPKCRWFTYFLPDSPCALLSDCEELDESSHDCVSGEKRCEVETDTTTASGETTTTTSELTTSPPDKESPWHMLLGGNSEEVTPFLHNVELFNWQTGEQCTFGSLPFALAAPIGAIFEGQPVYCGGGHSYIENRCFKFDSASKTWIQIENLLSAIYWAASAVVPGRGWFIYGGLNNPPTYSQMLTSISSQWEIGPQLYQSENEYGHCIVQVNESTTVFLGGMNNPTAIVSFDWTTMSYTKLSPELTSGRSFSACALVQGSNGESLAVVASGLISKGMEGWNSVSGQVQIIDSNFPLVSERGAPQLVSVKGGSELIFYEASNLNHGIWKYVYLTNTWTKIGTTLEYRNDFAALPVFDVACP